MKIEIPTKVADRLYDLVEKVMILDDGRKLDEKAARKYKALNAYRKAALVAYDLYNNGLINTHPSTAKAAFGDIFPRRGDYINESVYDAVLFSEKIENRVETVLIERAKEALYEAVKYELI